MNAFCLFCETEHCRYIAHAAENVFGCRAILPIQIQHRSTDRGPRDVPRLLLPGYVFLYFEEDQPVPEPPVFRMLVGVIRPISDSSHQYRLTGRDEQFALNLLSIGGVLGKTPVCREGDRVRIADGPYAGLITRIRRVDRRHRRMQVEIPFANQLVTTWLEYDLIDPAVPENMNPSPPGLLN